MTRSPSPPGALSASPWISIHEALQEEWADPEFRRAYRLATPKYRLIRELIRLRRRLGITQTQLAQRSAMYQSSISKIEAGEEDPRWSTIIRIADAMDADVEVSLCPRLTAADFADFTTVYAGTSIESAIHVTTPEPVSAEVIA